VSSHATPAGVVITATKPDGTTVNITEGVQTLYDLTIDSMDWGSGFLTAEDAAPVVEIAKTCGFTRYEAAEAYVKEYLASEARVAEYRKKRGYA
jgi:hypothetical protein